MRRQLDKWLGAMLLAMLVMLPASLAHAGVSKSFGTPESLGNPIQQVALFDSTYGVENGQDMMYTTSSGNPAIFNVINLDENRVERSMPLPAGGNSWTHTTAPDGSVYIGVSSGGAWLMKYTPGSDTLQHLGAVASDAKSVWSLTTDEQGNVYGGTFDKGKVFKYDPVSGAFTDYGVMIAGRDYVHGIAYRDGYVYAGIGLIGDLVKLNVTTGEKTVIPIKPITGLSVSPFVQEIDIRGDYLFAYMTSDAGNLYAVYDLVNEIWLEHEFWGVRGLKLSPELDNKVYIIQNNMLTSIDLTTFEAQSVGIEYPSFLRGSEWVQLDNDPELTGTVLVTANYFGSIRYFDVAAGTITVRDPGTQGGALNIHALEKGPNDELYMSGYIGAQAAVYSHADGSLRTFQMGQAESIGHSGNYVYFGVYPGAEIFRYDTTKPVQTDPAEPDVNPQLLFKVEHEQDRPYVQTSGDGKMFFGTIPDYGKTGGALTIFDESDPAGTKQVHRHVVQDQSIVGLAYRDGLIYGSTSLAGGLDSNPPAANAKMFIWDVASGQKLAEWEPQIPGATVAPKMISGLAFDSNGLLWAAADGALFAVDPATREVVKSKQIYPGAQNYGMWRPVHIRFAADGMLYTDVYGKIIAVDPETMEHTPSGVDASLFTLVGDNTIYYGKAGTLYRMSVENELYPSPGELHLEAPARLAVDGTFSVKVKMNNAEQLYGANISLQYDHQKLQLADVTVGADFSEGAFLEHTDSLGVFEAVITQTGDTGLNGNVEVLTLTFQTREMSGLADIVLKQQSTVGALHTAESGIIYPMSADQSASVQILIKLEDLNGDDVVNILDLVAIAKRAGDPAAPAMYDLNGDGVVDGTDVSLVAMAIFQQ
ncbi:dockerin type I domain-containing protein [Paenibacillus chungangensis]|uniref:Dockerin type I domain-containing protein n=1 Tax=Paenibacillus chungangensis TaxID=696535 RepID=A0ABW3HQA2_9BACL